MLGDERGGVCSKDVGGVDTPLTIDVVLGDEYPLRVP
jgi:hypothetical protein